MNYKIHVSHAAEHDLHSAANYIAHQLQNPLAARRMLAADAVTPEAVAEQVIEALRSEEFLILPHPQVTDYCLARASDPTGWLSRMNGLQQRLEH